MPGRKQDPIWAEFERSKAGTGYKAMCNTCGSTMQGIPARMKHHLDTRRNKTAEQTENNDEEDIRIVAIRTAINQTIEPTPSTSQAAQSPMGKKRKTLDDYATKTNSEKAHEIDTLIAKMIFATNSSFRVVEHPTFIAMIAALRPGELSSVAH